MNRYVTMMALVLGAVSLAGAGEFEKAKAESGIPFAEAPDMKDAVNSPVQGKIGGAGVLATLENHAAGLKTAEVPAPVFSDKKAATPGFLARHEFYGSTAEAVGGIVGGVVGVVGLVVIPELLLLSLIPAVVGALSADTGAKAAKRFFLGLMSVPIMGAVIGGELLEGLGRLMGGRR